jgi:hypothetical protein
MKLVSTKREVHWLNARHKFPADSSEKTGFPVAASIPSFQATSSPLNRTIDGNRISKKGFFAPRER